MNTRYEVIIIGAGPAGLIAGLECARAGLKVLLLEKDATIGLPLNCAEGVPRRSFENVITPRPEWIKSIIERGRLVAPCGHHFDLDYTRAGYVLDRPRMERDLAVEYTTLGGELACRCRAEELHIKNKRFKSLSIVDAAGKKRTIEADIFIAADGVEGTIARKAGLDNRLNLKETESLLQYRLKNISVEPDLIEFHLGSDIAPRSYAWVFPHGETEANVGLGVPSDINSGRDAVYYLDRFVARRFGKAERGHTSCGTCPRYRGRNILARLNLLVVGDSARVLDSLTGAGIVNAMLSGQLAARAALKYVKREIATLKELHQHYPGRFLELKHYELSMFLKIKKLLVKLSDPELDDMVLALDEHFIEKKVDTFNPIAIIMGIIKKKPRLLKMARHLF
ncbi:MAG: NAD(P)/FAD-dependent oxidoreductase [candidate division Zixibacteria bacterium]|nr:NAD(P)/FAD-dependent oxidoreductase [candidate division Zixibacteria bacterium]